MIYSSSNDPWWHGYLFGEGVWTFSNQSMYVMYLGLIENRGRCNSQYKTDPKRWCSYTGVLPEVVSIDHSNTYRVALNTLVVYFGKKAIFDECFFFQCEMFKSTSILYLSGWALVWFSTPVMTRRYYLFCTALPTLALDGCTMTLHDHDSMTSTPWPSL